MSEVKNIPRLRFPEFEEIWKSSKVGDLFEFKNGLNKEKEFFGRGIPIINFMDVYMTPHLTSKNLSGLVDLSESEISRFSVIQGDVFFTRTSETIYDIGMSSSLIEDIPNCVFSGFTLRARPKENIFDSRFTGYLFRTEKIRKEITTKSSMTTRALTSGSLLKKVVFNYPNSKVEQQKIADFLTAVDKRIELLEKKKTLLETYKMGVMKRIFNQEIRFKDDNGNDFPDWEEKRLEDVLNYEQPTKYLVDSTEYSDSYNLPVLTAGKSFILGYTNETIGIFSKLPTIIFDDFTTSFHYVDFEFKVKSSAMKMLTVTSDDYNLKFIFESMKTLRFVLSEHKRYWISEYSKLFITIPSIEEQIKISNLSNQLDKQMELLQTQIDKSKTWKKGLLQKMFV